MLRIEVRFCWVSPHICIKENEGAYRIAQKAIRMKDIINVPFGKGEVKVVIKKQMMEKWQTRWDKDCSGRKYYRIQKSINAQGVKRKNRKEETVLTRLRFDHTGLNETLFMLGKSQSDECMECK